MDGYRYTSVDKMSNLPYYIQVSTEIKKAIDEKILKPGDKIPNEFDLAEKFNVSRPTIRQAIKELELEGLVERIKGVGTFIKKKLINTTLMQEFNYGEELGILNVDFKIKVLENKIIEPSEDIRKIMHLKGKDKINYIANLRVIDDEPVVYTISYTPYNLFKNLTNEDLENNTIPFLIERKYNIYIAKVERYLEPVSHNFDKKASQILNIKKDQSYAYYWTYYYNKKDELIAYFKGFLSPSRSRFSFYQER